MHAIIDASRDSEMVLLLQAGDTACPGRCGRAGDLQTGLLVGDFCPLDSKV